MSEVLSKKSTSNCAECGAYLTLDSMVCIECGINQRTRRRISSANRPSGITPLIRIVLGVASVLVAMNLIALNRPVTAQIGDQPDLFARNETSLPRIEPAPSPEPKSESKPRPVHIPQERVVVPTSDPEPTPPPIDDVKPLPLPAPEPPLTPDRGPTDTPEPMTPPESIAAPESTKPTIPTIPTDPEAKLIEQKDQLLAKITKDMNRTHPMLNAGRIHTMATRSGPQSGMVNLVGRDYLLMTVNGTPKRIPFNQLQTKSRIRVDRTFREKMIEDMTLRKLAESRNKQE